MHPRVLSRRCRSSSPLCRTESIRGDGGAASARAKQRVPDLFQARCRLPVLEAEDKAPISGGTIYFAPPDYHLLVEVNKSVSLSSDEPVLFSRPSIDVLFESAADAYGAALIGIVLTGADRDGAKGMRAITEAGGIGLIQNPHEAFAPAMPEAAIETCPSGRVMSLEAIATYLRGV